MNVDPSNPEYADPEYAPPPTQRDTAPNNTPVIDSTPVIDTDPVALGDLAPPPPGHRIRALPRALVDRRHPTVTPVQPAAPPSESALIVEELRLLRELLSQQRSDPETVVLTDAPVSQDRLRNWPSPSNVRRIIRRTGLGGLYVLTATPVQVAVATPTRLALRLSNDANSPNQVVVTLGGASGPGISVPSMILDWGAVWDGRVGGHVWCGNVFANALATTTDAANLYVAEF